MTLPFPFVRFLLCFFYFGVFSSVEVIVFAVARELSPSHLAATSVAFTNFVIMIGGVLFQPLVGLLLDFHAKGRMQAVCMYILYRIINSHSLFCLLASFWLCLLPLFCLKHISLDVLLRRIPIFFCKNPYILACAR